MPTYKRVLIAVAILLIDIVIFIVPLIAAFAAYIIVMRPPWFKKWIDQLYSDV